MKGNSEVVWFEETLKNTTKPEKSVGISRRPTPREYVTEIRSVKDALSFYITRKASL